MVVMGGRSGSERGEEVVAVGLCGFLVVEALYPLLLCSEFFFRYMAFQCLMNFWLVVRAYEMLYVSYYGGLALVNGSNKSAEIVP